MASPYLATPPERFTPTSPPSESSTRLIASFGDALAAHCAARMTDGNLGVADLSQPATLERLRGLAEPVESRVLFLKPHLTAADLAALDSLAALLGEAAFVGVVSSFEVHLGNEAASRAEQDVVDLLKQTTARVVVFRPGHMTGANSFVQRSGFAYPLMPSWLRSCFLETQELCDAITDEQRRTDGPRHRIVTLLGANRPWRDVLREHKPGGIWSACLTSICFVLAFLMLGQLAALLLVLLARWRPSLRRWSVRTLQPANFTELLALCNRHNRRHVKIVGYNNGVVHFGHRYPGKTVVSTVRCHRIVRASAAVIKADCGATIRQAMDFLAAANQELYVIPNYSYVCLGTALFVPIHGSASDYTTVAETIIKALFYDPGRERFILATSDEPAFRDAVYNQASDWIVLRVWLRVKPKSRYFAQREECVNADSATLLSALRDTVPANVEIRKSGAASTQVQISRYYTAPPPLVGKGKDGAAVLEIPRDALGRLWDRLEENALTSFLMHLFARTLVWHVELFFTAEEFATFWRTHAALPLRKIQLRYIRRDGLPHSPFCEQDCVSVDLFLFRWNRATFEAYLKQTFAVIRSNPGKHSQ